MAAPPTPSAAWTLGRYRIDALLGEGGMGAVYRGYDPVLARAVAVKVLRLESVDPADDAGLRRASESLLREARAAAALKHPNTVAIHDLGEASGQPFIVMELVEGRLLRAFVGARDVPIPTRVHWLAGIARALGAAHAAGLVHRDIKPENVMIDAEGTAKVLDFGIARPLRAPASTRSSMIGGQDTLASQVAGTPLYMATELLGGARADARSDQFAWAVTAYELLTGMHPMATGTWPPRLGGRPPRPCDEIAPVPPAIAAAVMRAMWPSPEQRFASMREITAVLDAFVAASIPPPGVAGLAGPASPPFHVDPTAPTQPAVVRDATFTTQRGQQGRWRIPWVIGSGVAIAAGTALVVGFAIRSQTLRHNPAVGSPAGLQGERFVAADLRQVGLIDFMSQARAYVRRVRPGAELTTAALENVVDGTVDATRPNVPVAVAGFQYEEAGENKALSLVLQEGRMRYAVGARVPKLPPVTTRCSSRELWKTAEAAGLRPGEPVHLILAGVPSREPYLIMEQANTTRFLFDAETCKLTQMQRINP
jgi:tRNA A-37 threonylcarbamoyl transferase component Bud32